MMTKWGDGPDTPFTDAERMFYRVLFWICVAVLAIVGVTLLIHGGIVEAVGFCFLVFGPCRSLGKWLAPNIKRLDTDRYPQGKDFERASPSLSSMVAWANLGGVK